ncbi:MAG: UDP-N-acetylglucosamine 2-epimerase (hydrolyzing) [Lachnospiraceae bacterium]|nr:UDP-N-acetylglucosamine 2-epimerase (hydrolyzing) [Lachnospiraceae bacterium]
MKRIAVVTATRAEYWLLYPVIRAMRKDESAVRTELIVTGTHLSEDYGMTVREIEESGVRIEKRIGIPTASGCAADISGDQAETLIRFTELFDKEKYDAVMLLGDRYELLAIAIAAGNTRTPIFHLCGGDTTEGAMDEWIRHSVTKMSYLHFVMNEDSRKRVIQMGEDPERVFNYGSTGVDNALYLADLSKKEALESIGLPDSDYAICTYHPVTLGDENPDELIEEFLEALKAFPEIMFIVTMANADHGGKRINELLREAEPKMRNMRLYSSLGAKRYLSLVKHSLFVLGNSSSGIIEAPVFHVPTVNIGERQRGRLRAESVIDSGTGSGNIVSAIRQALSRGFRESCSHTENPYGDGHAAEKIAGRSIATVLEEKIDLKKVFFDL